MGTLFEKVKDILFPTGDNDDENDYIDDDEQDMRVTDYNLDVTDINTIRSQNKAAATGRGMNMSGDISTYILRVAPNSFDEVKDYVDCLKDKKVLVINLENIDFPLAQRIMDFLGGAAYSMEGSIEECGKNVYIIAHKNADVSSYTVRKSDYAAKKGLSWISNR